MGSFQGQASDVAIQAKEILRMRESLNEILAFHTHQDIEKIRKDSDRDFFMSGQEAKDYGIVDHVITQREGEATEKEE
jgi:ATP-dependent Clp protease protease subunit